MRDYGDDKGPHEGTFPAAMNSTAYNVDYTMAMRRACYEGLLWLGAQTRGDMEGRVGLWFSGQWHAGEAEYRRHFRETYASRPWLAW